MSRPALAAFALCLAACTFPTDGVRHQGDDDVTDIDGAVPPDACVAGTETCDGVDNDCDGNIDEGLTSGAACDGDDADLCMDDQIVCDSNGAEVCSSGADNVEACNDADDDCDTNTDEDFALGVPCDGADGDQCIEGVTVCAGDGLATVCDDATGTTTEICNGADEDCDGTNDNGFDLVNDPNNCGSCNHVCTNAHGQVACNSTCTPTCDIGAANCDANVDNGCELQDTNPTCALASTSAITVNGDAASTGSTTGTTEQFVRVHIAESVSGGGSDLTAGLSLVSGAGTDFDLFVYCPGACTSTPLTDTDDAVEVGKNDVSGNSQYDVIVEIRYHPGSVSTTCAQWTLNVTGAVTTTNRCGG